MEDIHTENRTLIKETEDDSKKRKDISCSWTGRTNTVKMAYPTQSNLQVSYNHYQTTHDIFHRTRTNNTKIYMDPQKTQNCQSNPEEKEQSRSHNPPRLQTILQSYSNQNSMVWAQK